MKIEGTHIFTASREIVWPLLLNPEVLASVLPGCEELEQVGEHEYKGVLQIRIGPIQGKFHGVVTLSEINAPEGFQLSVDGKGAPGFIKGSGKLELAADNGSTRLQYEGDAHVGGRIASVGQRLLDTSARAIVRQSLEGLDLQVQAQSQPTAVPGTGPTSIAPKLAAPTQTEFASGVVKNMLEELIPPEKRAGFFSKSLLVLGAILFLSLIDRWRINRIARKVASAIQKQGGQI
jgi:carbon monoxide dehydrogenase subunit G